MLDVEVVEQSTGDFNIAGGYSTTDGLLAEVKLGDSNFLGTGKALKSSVSYGQYARSIDLSASEPYFLGTRVSAGIELYGRQNDASAYQSYGSDVYGATVQFGAPLTEQLGVQYRYSLYNQNVTLDTASLAAAPSLPTSAGSTGRSRLGLLRRRHRDLQYVGQQQNSDQRNQVATLAGPSQDSAGKRELPADDGRHALLPPPSTMTWSAWFAPRAATSPAGEANRCR